MASFSWEAGYRVDVGPMDRQHKRIFEQMAAIYGSLPDKAGHDDVDNMLDRFDIYCKMHFFEEERAMEEMNFPSIIGHKRQHDQFVLHLDSFRSDYRSRSTHDASDAFKRIKEWFVNHILTEDMQYSAFYICKQKN